MLIRVLRIMKKQTQFLLDPNSSSEFLLEGQISSYSLAVYFL